MMWIVIDLSVGWWRKSGDFIRKMHIMTRDYYMQQKERNGFIECYIIHRQYQVCPCEKGVIERERERQGRVSGLGGDDTGTCVTEKCPWSKLVNNSCPSLCQSARSAAAPLTATNLLWQQEQTCVSLFYFYDTISPLFHIHLSTQCLDPKQDHWTICSDNVLLPTYLLWLPWVP